MTFPALLEDVVDRSGTGRPVPDPATGRVFAVAPDHGPDAVAPAVAAARRAQEGWAAATSDERAATLHAAADAVERRADELAAILALEQGKPLDGPNARFEVAASVDWVRATADLPEPDGTRDVPGDLATVAHRPVGVVAAITPWNWPMMIATWQIAPALRMGNAVIAKPSEYTTLSGLALCAVMNEALPPGVLHAVVGDGAVGARLVADPGVGKVMFTGSTATGRRIVEASAANLARLTLELGGNDPAIVLPDADPRAIAADLFWGAFTNSGQTCAAVKRVYAHDAVHDDLVEALAELARTTPMGPASDPSSLLGPLQNRRQWEIVDRLVESAKSGGARVAAGGNPDRTAPGNFYPATIVSDLGDDAPLVHEEQFGPALPVVRFHDIEEAVASANAFETGLGASVWSGDPERARSVAARIDAGTVWINAHGGLHPAVPFGGVKQSGYGTEFGVDGLRAVSVAQVIRC
ncbi:aldehyde dehydrogenase family protein [Agromyces sp. Q22]|uniref:Aldehyde dehydrogenase family protein n=2 Tax=Agromyces kandeliae TaxID=2666141 RepID=A0A6L5R4V0_9MICO|nr:aldehyde dehydrogenase family protein [Agromyces kandeliae]